MERTWRSDVDGDSGKVFKLFFSLNPRSAQLLLLLLRNSRHIFSF